MILTTTNSIEGFKIIDYKGLVTGVAANYKKASFTFNLEKYFDSLEVAIEEVKEEAFQKLSENVNKLNANAIVGIKIDVETSSTSCLIMVSVIGTAVQVQ